MNSLAQTPLAAGALTPQRECRRERCERSKFVVCEKPLAPTLEAVDRILEGYFREPDPLALPSLPAHAAMHCFLHAYQCLRHPRDAARYEDAEAMLAACEAALDRGIE